MAGVKGRSGGARDMKGKTGGARPGAGRKPKPATVILPTSTKKGDGEPFDPRPALEQIAQGLIEVSAQQLKALSLLLPYTNTKKGEGGKKEGQAEAAKKVAGRFSAAAPPKLVAAGGKKV